MTFTPHRLDLALKKTEADAYGFQPAGTLARLTIWISIVAGYFDDDTCTMPEPGTGEGHLLADAMTDVVASAISWLRALGVEDPEQEIKAELDRAAADAPGPALDPATPIDLQRFAFLVHQLGQVARALTREAINTPTGNGSGLAREITRLGTFAAAWLSRYLPDLPGAEREWTRVAYEEVRVGDVATHFSGLVDPHRVCAVDGEAKKVRFEDSPRAFWFPMSGYLFHRQVDAESGETA